MSVFAQILSRNRHKHPVLLHIMDTVLSSADALNADAQQNPQWNQRVARTACNPHWERAAARVVHSLGRADPPVGPWRRGGCSSTQTPTE